ncbi:Tannase/feruloyl esterase [Xylariales sp. PMI_506]|nr:Tannase/feruloyl esterase [Xylariales sp. PMI_506]
MSSSLANACIPATFSASSFFGAKIQSIEASIVTGFSVTVPAEFRFSQPTVVVNNATFCNVTVTYTHPGEGDTVIVEAWLPPDDFAWNGMFQAVGGNGWIAGRSELQYLNMAAVVYEGYATITTDAGIGSAVDASWALLSPGNLNLYLVDNFMSRALNEEALLGKSLMESYYGTGPTYSYWNGCSQGGRQGLALAQQYPNAYDGIVAGTPVINLQYVAWNVFWAQEWMSVIQAYPYGCEIDSILAAAVTACDNLDGVTDGIIYEPEKCLTVFNPFQVVGNTIENCSQTHDARQISEAAASVVNATWNGIVSAEGKSLWYGLFPGADITSDYTDPSYESGTAATNCTSGICTGSPNPLTTSWIRDFITRDPDFDYSNITHEEFDQMIHYSLQQFSTSFATNDPDLSEFHRAGGKMISFHGLADNTVAFGGTEKYYLEVSALLPEVQDFYRLYRVPGLGHCFSGKSGQPETLFSELRAWVENGTAPESLPVTITDLDDHTQNRIICPYPQNPQFDESCGDSGNAGCWSCLTVSQSTKQ